MQNPEQAAVVVGATPLRDRDPQPQPEGDTTMRFMVMVKANKDSEAGKLPSEKELIEMGKYNEELIGAGMMLAGEGLHPSSKGLRIQFTPDGKAKLTDGPFAEAKELIAGFWILQAKSKEELLQWLKRCPPFVGELEVRQVYEAAEFEPVIHTPEGRATLEAEQAFRDRTAP
jgi:hypothetical protein